MDETKALFEKLYQNLGEQYQLVVVKEELAELTQAISKYQRNAIKQEKFGETEGELEVIMNNIVEETADALFTLRGMMGYFKIEERVIEKMEDKLYRTEDRASKYLRD